jgi:hypothetical protein
MRSIEPKHALWGVLIAAALGGAIVGSYGVHDADPPRAVRLVVSLLLMVLVYLWYVLDARERKFKRSVALGGAVVLFSAIAVPYYLYRSRPRGQRAAALGGFVGLLLLAWAVAALSVALVSVVAANGG